MPRARSALSHERRNCRDFRTTGQDLVEYALVVALIAFGAVAGMKRLSSEINTAFNTISSDLSSSL
jgi:Flp pilus assembly pilin Flp